MRPFLLPLRAVELEECRGGDSNPPSALLGQCPSQKWPSLVHAGQYVPTWLHRSALPAITHFSTIFVWCIKTSMALNNMDQIETTSANETSTTILMCTAFAAKTYVECRLPLFIGRGKIEAARTEAEACGREAGFSHRRRRPRSRRRATDVPPAPGLSRCERDGVGPTCLPSEFR